jgi:hypothetical protein
MRRLTVHQIFLLSTASQCLLLVSIADSHRIRGLLTMCAEGAEVTTIASTTELAEAATFVEGDEVVTMAVATEAEVGSIIVGEATLAAETAAVATAEVASSWNIVRLVFQIQMSSLEPELTYEQFLVAAGAVVLAGTYAWQKHKESQDAETLKGAIAKVATARLYALVYEQSLLRQTDQKAS